MNNQITTIQLVGSGGTTGYLDVAPETVFPLNFSLGDIRDISKKNGTSSKSITLSGTKNNNKLLNNYFDLNVLAGTFNINIKQECIVIQNGVIVMDNAVMQLVEVNKTQAIGNIDEKITYTVLLKDSTGDFFSNINNKLLTDLDFSNLDHIYTADNVISSFNNTITDGYKYLMPFNPSVSGDSSFFLEEFTPTIYAKKYFDNIFSNAGFSYSWTGSTGTTVQFDKLVIPYNGDALKPTLEESLPYAVSAKTLSTQIFSESTHGTGLIAPILSTFLVLSAETYDPSNSYTPATSTYVYPTLFNTNNNIDFKFELSYEIYTVNSSGANAYVEPYPSGVINTKGIEIHPQIYLTKNGVNAPSSAGNFLPNGSIFLLDDTVIPNGTHTLTSSSAIFTINAASPVAGDIFKFKTQSLISGRNLDGSSQVYGFYSSTAGSGSVGLVAVEIKYKITSIKISIIPKIADLGYNAPVVMNKFIPKQIKQSDFIKSIFTMYNIVAEIDKDNQNNLILTQRDAFYDAGKVENWTKKLAKEKEQQIKFLPELSTKKIVLTYKEDKDISNTTYTQATSEIYGQLEYSFDNEYIKGKTNQEVIFSPSPVINSNFGAILPMVDGKAPKTNIRILIDGGEYSCGTYSIQNYVGNTVSGTTYPHLSHWDKPMNPTFDINFGVCDYYLRSDNYGADTGNNLFNLNWRRTFNQINSGKMMIAYFNLNEYDIQKMRLNDKIRIDNSWWNINKVMDYDANGKGLTKVELISIDDNLSVAYIKKTPKLLGKGNPVIHTVVNVLGGKGKPYNNTFETLYPVEVQGKKNFISDTAIGGNIIGDNNNIQTKQAIILGSNNQVESDAMVFGSNNEIQAGLEGSVVFGSNITATTSNTVYVSNLQISSGGTINGTNVSGLTNINIWTYGSGTESIIANNGTGNIASGFYSYAEGAQNIASGNYSHAEGQFTTASGQRSHAEGQSTTASGDFGAHAGGSLSIASGDVSFVHGDNSRATGNGTIVLGSDLTGNTANTTYVNKFNIKSIGSGTSVVNLGLDVSGNVVSGNVVSGSTGTPYIRGWENESELGNAILIGKGIGQLTLTNGSDEIVGIGGVDFTDESTFNSPFYYYEATIILPDGTRKFLSLDSFSDATNGLIFDIYSDGNYVNSLGALWTGTTGNYDYYPYFIPVASGDLSHAEGKGNLASGTNSHAEGVGTISSGAQSHSEGNSTKATNLSSHAEGQNTLASGSASHAEGSSSTASGNASHAEGSSKATNTNAHAEGASTTASGGFGAHSEGFQTQASGSTSHAEGYLSYATGDVSHAEGQQTIASGLYSHSEGNHTTAAGESSHAGGQFTIASGINSFVHGSGSTASGIGTIVLGNNITGSTTNTVYVPSLILEGTTSSFVLSRLTTTQRNALTAVNGMLIYNTTTNKFEGYENGAWANLI